MSPKNIAEKKTNLFRLAFIIFMIGNASFFALAILRGGDELFISLINATMGSIALALGLLSVLIPEILKAFFSSKKNTTDDHE